MSHPSSTPEVVEQQQRAYIREMEAKVSEQRAAVAQLASDYDALTQLLADLPQPTPQREQYAVLVRSRSDLLLELESVRLNRKALLQAAHDTAAFLGHSVGVAQAQELPRATLVDSLSLTNTWAAVAELYGKASEEAQASAQARDRALAQLQSVSTRLDARVGSAASRAARAPPPPSRSEPALLRDPQWAQEQAQLLREYRALLKVNHEQRFHLSRSGSNNSSLGAEPEEKPWILSEIKDLKAERAELERQLSRVRVQQRDVRRQQGVIGETAGEHAAWLAAVRQGRAEELQQLRRELEQTQQTQTLRLGAPEAGEK